jgi:hypothetical protein
LKSRVHISLARKIVHAVRFLDPKARDDAIITLIDNAELLYPIFAAVLTVAKSVFDDLSSAAQVHVHQKIVDLIESHSHVLRVELNLAFAIRLLSCRHSPEAERHWQKSTRSLVRRRCCVAISS